MTSARGSSELNQLRYVWRSSELCDKISILSFPYRLSILFALVAIATAIVAKLVRNTWHCFTEKAEKNAKISQMIQQKLCTVYTRIFRAYFFRNLAKKNWGAHII